MIGSSGMAVRSNGIFIALAKATASLGGGLRSSQRGSALQRAA